VRNLVERRGHEARHRPGGAEGGTHLTVLLVHHEREGDDRDHHRIARPDLHERLARAAGLDARDRALAQRMAYGTVQRRRTLDHAIESLGRRPVSKLDPPVRAALRLGAYQLGYLDSVPAHAAVGESVELVRAAGLERYVAFTNAIMRRLAEGSPERLSSGVYTASAGNLAQGVSSGEAISNIEATAERTRQVTTRDIWQKMLPLGRRKLTARLCA